MCESLKEIWKKCGMRKWNDERALNDNIIELTQNYIRLTW